MNHRHLHPAQIDGAAFVKADRLNTLGLFPPAHQIILPHDRHAQPLAQIGQVGGVIDVARHGFLQSVTRKVAAARFSVSDRFGEL